VIRVHLVDPAELPTGLRAAALQEGAAAVFVIRNDVSAMEIVESINRLGRNMRNGMPYGKGRRRTTTEK
jgi:hypothetical protein